MHLDLGWLEAHHRVSHLTLHGAVDASFSSSNPWVLHPDKLLESLSGNRSGGLSTWVTRSNIFSLTCEIEFQGSFDDHEQSVVAKSIETVIGTAEVWLQHLVTQWIY